MNTNIHIITKQGKRIALVDWQLSYGLPIGSDKVGMFFSTKDRKLAEDIKDYGELTVNEQLMRVLDKFREKVGPVIINGFNRNQAKQESLFEQGYRTAVYSPHVALMAADIETKTAAQTQEWVKILQRVAAELGIKIRIGFKQYLSAGQTFIHLDVTPEYYAVGKPFHSMPHPIAWEQTLTW